MAEIHLELDGLYGGTLILDVPRGATASELTVVDREGNKARVCPDSRQMMAVSAMGSAFLAGVNHHQDLDEPVDGHWDRCPALTGSVTMSTGMRSDVVLGVDEKDGSAVPLIALDADRLQQLAQTLSAGAHDL